MNLIEKIKAKETKLAVIGLGYVGLPLAVEFGKVVNTIGFDLNQKRIETLKDNIDYNKEISGDEIKKARHLEFTDAAAKIKEAGFIIIAVPTPITKSRQPDLTYLIKASEIAGTNLRKGSAVVFESTVYPGVTEDICVPALEKTSGLKYKEDFKVGYSPERINPGDKTHTIKNIVKVVSGCDGPTLDCVGQVYSLIVEAGVYKAESIKCAEAAKVIENTQRDLNIALMNELAMIFGRIGVNTSSVLEAAGTKWNFIKMHPGLVGGHCIGVDPYYLTFKAEEVKYHPQVILAGRRINDEMGKYIAEQTVKSLIEADKTVKGAKVVVLGMTFKENVSDIRNSRVIDIVTELKDYGVDVIVCDPLADRQEVKLEYGIELTEYSRNIQADGIVIAVSHQVFKNDLTPERLKECFTNNGAKGVVFDVKGMFKPEEFDNAAVVYRSL